MEVILNYINEHERELHINTPWKTIEDDYNDLLKRYAKLPVHGFRAGKTPRSATESFYRQQIKNDLVTLVSTRLCRSALKEKELTAGSPIEISESQLKPYDSLLFKANFIEMPTFDLPDYRRLNLQATDPEDQLNEVSIRLLEQTDIDLPPVFVDDELRYTELTGETATEEERSDAEDRVKLMIIIKKIAEQDNVEIQLDEIDERMKAVADDIGSTPRELKDFLINNNGWARFVDSLLAEQVLQYIIGEQIESIPTNIE